MSHFGSLEKRIIGVFEVTGSCFKAKIKDSIYCIEKSFRSSLSNKFAQESNICITSAPAKTCFLKYKKHASVSLERKK